MRIFAMIIGKVAKDQSSKTADVKWQTKNIIKITNIYDVMTEKLNSTETIFSRDIYRPNLAWKSDWMKMQRHSWQQRMISDGLWELIDL
jgi:hypothetical protein